MNQDDNNTLTADPQSKFLHYAQHYAVKYGWRVFPIRPRTKLPLTEHGFYEATTDLTKINQWWTENPQANIAVQTGLSFSVFDVDPKHGGDETLRGLINKYGELPDTVSQTTGSGGTHYFFSNIFKTIPGLFPGIDIKGMGGYVLLHPSVNEDGNPYVWDGLTKRKILEAPEWLKSLILDNRRKHNSTTIQKVDSLITVGNRHNSLVKKAREWRATGMPQTTLHAALVDYFNNHCVQDGDDYTEEISQIVEWSMTNVTLNSNRTIHVPAPASPEPQIQPEPREETITIHTNGLAPSVEILNSTALIRNAGIQFVSIRRRGQTTIAKAHIGQEMIFPTISSLTTFAQAKDVIANATGLFPRTPGRNVRREWEPIAQMMLGIASRDYQPQEHPMKDEFSSILPMVWERAGNPLKPDTDESVFRVIVDTKIHSRDPHAEPRQCCVWGSQGFCFVHLPSLLSWLGCTVALNIKYNFDEARMALALLGFDNCQDYCSPSVNGRRVKANLWKGPISVLG